MTDSSAQPDTENLHGLLVLDKPSGITSRGALDRAAGWFPRGTRLGHAGTLDPLASGVLVLCLGRATRLVEFVQDLPKTYKARIRLGAHSDTDDATGACVPVPDVCPPALGEIQQAIGGFVGPISQVPPRYSAAHVQGRRAYKLARKEREFKLTPRTITIERIAIDAYHFPHLDLTIDCGKGTYIRSLARDLGESLGCGGLIAALRRTRVGIFEAEGAVSLEVGALEAHQRIRPIGDAVAHLPRLTLSETLVHRFCLGQRLAQQDIAGFQPTGATDLAVFDSAGRLAAIARFDSELARFSPVKVLRAESPATDQAC